MYLHCKWDRRRESERLFTIHSLPGAGAGRQQELHFHSGIINQWKSLPRDVMGARSVKGVQKGIIQINGRESLQRLLNNEPGSSLWLSSLCAPIATASRAVRAWSFLLFFGWALLSGHVTDGVGRNEALIWPSQAVQCSILRFLLLVQYKMNSVQV